ncbi:MAG: redoxin domain-containing protein [Bacteroidota bacterium]
MRKSLMIIVLFTLTICMGQAQQIKDFSLTNVMTGESVALSSLKASKGVVIIFTSHTCPYAKYYDRRINKLISSYEGAEVNFLMVNSEVKPQESAEAMLAEAKSKGYKVPYLADKNQTVMKMLGVKKSPEAVVLKRNGQGFSVLYLGAIDNNPQVESDVKEQYLLLAIKSLLDGTKPAKTTVRPIGCIIKGA